MPNMDQTGPRCAERAGGVGFGRHAGRGNYGFEGRRFSGCRCGLGLCAQSVPDRKEALTLRRDALQRSLNAVNAQLETL